MLLNVRPAQEKSIVPVIIFLVAYSILCFPETAQAGYLDPGSGSTLVQGIIAAIAAVKRFWGNILGLFGIKPKS